MNTNTNTPATLPACLASSIQPDAEHGAAVGEFVACWHSGDGQADVWLTYGCATFAEAEAAARKELADATLWGYYDDEDLGREVWAGEGGTIHVHEVVA